MSAIQRVLGLPWGLLPVGCTQKTSKGRRPGDISDAQNISADSFQCNVNKLATVTLFLLVFFSGI